MFALIFALLSTPAYAGGGVYMSLEESTTIASCNNGQVKFQEELWDYGEDGTETKWALVANVNGKQEVFRVSVRNSIFNNQGSKVNLLLNYDLEDEQGIVTIKSARLETNVSFDGSAGTISAWRSEKGEKGSLIFDSLAVKDCYLE